MDPRSNKACDFVAAYAYLTEEMKKSKHLQIKWLQKYEWLIHEQIKLEHEMREVCKEKAAYTGETEVIDNRTCLPALITGNNNYGWLASKSPFTLETYGFCSVKYPLEEIPKITGNIPEVAAGIGHI